MNVRRPKSPAAPFLGQVTPVTALVVVVVAVVDLGGWLAGSPGLLRLASSYVPMAPATAIGFVALATGLLLRRGAARSVAKRDLGLVAALVSLGLGLLVLFQDLTRSTLGVAGDVEHVLVPSARTPTGLTIGRMSPLTALLFIVLAVAVLVAEPPSRRPRSRWLFGQSLGAIALTLATGLVVGYWYGEPFMYGGPLVPVALPTAALFLLLAAALLFDGPEMSLWRVARGTSTFSRIVRITVPGAVLLVLVEGRIGVAVLSSADPARYVWFFSASAVLTAALITALTVYVVRRVGASADRVETALREGTRILHESQRVGRLGSYRFDIAAGTWTSSPPLDDIFGIAGRDYRRDVDGWLGLVHPDEREAMRHYLEIHVAGEGRAFDREYRIVRVSDGAERWVHGRGELTKRHDGTPVELIGTIQDITDRRGAEAALRDSEERYRRLVEMSPDAIFVHVGGRFVFANAAGLDLLGAHGISELLGRPILDVVDPADRDTVRNRVREALEAGRTAPLIEETFVRLDGTPVAVEVTAIPLSLGGAPAVQVVARNVDARKRAEAAERKRLRQLAAVNRVARQAAGHLDEETLCAAVVGEIHEAFGYRAVALLTVDTERGELVRRSAAGTGGPVPHFRQPVATGLLGAAVTDGVSQVANDVRRDPRYVADPELDIGTRAEVCIPIQVGGAVAAVLDVQETAVGAFDDVDVQMLETVADQIALAISHARLFHRIQDELAHRARLSAAVEQAAESIIITRADGAILYVNPAFERVTGYSFAEVAGENPRVLKSGRHDAEFYRAMWETLAAGRPWHGDLVNRRKDGTLFEEEAVISPIRDASGAIVSFVAVKRDVTREREVEEQFRRAQRMEAIGRLAGGIAHDFNNLLQAIMASAQLLSFSDESAGATREVAEEIGEHVRRGAALTRQLLLFARRSVSRREPVDLNAVVNASRLLLRRLLRENIAIEARVAEEPIPVLLDRGQFDQVLMNLAVNAADAMPDGGTLTVTTGRGPEHGWLEVEDSGVGIAAELLDRIFEPFFTTKSAERGTGLGLAVVHGIVTQHGGAVSVRSRTGQGTVFRVTFPLASDSEVAEAASDETRGRVAGRGERILVVEDNPTVRGLLSSLLDRLGYLVVAVDSGEAAAALPDEPPFDLLLTDVMLPGVSGVEAARRLGERWPRLKVILVSGYAEDEILRRELASEEVRFLQKPVDLDTLARTVREALDGA